MFWAIFMDEQERGLGKSTESETVHPITDDSPMSYEEALDYLGVSHSTAAIIIVTIASEKVR
jgi:hypothetical protein